MYRLSVSVKALKTLFKSSSRFQNLSTLQQRHFSLSSILLQQTNAAKEDELSVSVEDSKLKGIVKEFKIKVNNESKLSAVNDITKIFRNDAGEEVVDICEHLINRSIRMAEWELIAVREQEMSNNLSMDDLAWRGIAICNLRFDKNYFRHIDSGGEIEIKLDYPKNEDESVLGARTFRPGALVKMILNEPGESFTNLDLQRARAFSSWKTIAGIVKYSCDSYMLIRTGSLSNGFMLEAFNKKKPQAIVHVVKQSDQNIAKNSIQALKEVRKERINPTMLKFLVGKSADDKVNDAKTSLVEEPPQKVVVFRKDLDESKLRAIELTADRHPLTIIHGPPGTGKTTCLAAAILSAVANGDRVLAVAPSHAAVDALTQSILSQWPVQTWGDSKSKVVRIGNDIRLTVPSLTQFLPQNLGQTSPARQKITSELLKVRTELLQNYNSKRGDLMAKELEICSEFRQLLLDEETKIVSKATIVLCTNAVAQGRVNIKIDIEEQKFNLVCIDEAGFALDLNTLPILLRSRRLILSGDHFQLPPVVVSDKAKADGLGVSLMERLVQRHPERVSLLTTQYRSNQLISGWSSQRFYDGLLQADSSVAKSRLSDLRGVTPCPETRTNILFVDTRGSNFHESVAGGTSDDESYSNFDEAFLVEQLVRNYIALGVKPSSIGVITPYWAQVAVLRSLLWDGPSDLQRVTIHTVDGFQGREKELIIISFVRSSPAKKVGFLSETRRINVSVTRAKRCCIAIGDSATLDKDDGLKSFIHFCKDNNAVIKVNQILK